MQKLIENSKLPSLLLDVTDRTIAQRIDYIADWLQATGGLNAAKSPPNPKAVLKQFVPSAALTAENVVSWNKTNVFGMEVNGSSVIHREKDDHTSLISNPKLRLRGPGMPG